MVLEYVIVIVSLAPTRIQVMHDCMSDHGFQSGGTTVKVLYECLGLTLANKAGVDPKFRHQNKREIVVFQPWPGVSVSSHCPHVNTSCRTHGSRPGLPHMGRMHWFRGLLT